VTVAQASDLLHAVLRIAAALEGIQEAMLSISADDDNVSLGPEWTPRAAAPMTVKGES
jgi:hypothetical protein